MQTSRQISAISQVMATEQDMMAKSRSSIRESYLSRPLVDQASQFPKWTGAPDDIEHVSDTTKDGATKQDTVTRTRSPT